MGRHDNLVHMQCPVYHMPLMQQLNNLDDLSKQLPRFNFRVEGQPLRNEIGQHQGITKLFVDETGLSGGVLYLSRVVRLQCRQSGCEIFVHPKGVFGLFGTD